MATDDLLDIARQVVKQHIGLHAAQCRPADYDDLLSDASLGAVKAMRDWTPGGLSRKNYAYLRARGELLDGVRRRAPAGRRFDRVDSLDDLPAWKKPSVPLRVHDEPDRPATVIADPTDPYEAVDNHLTVLALLRTLPEPLRQHTVDHYLDERSQAEIAAAAGVNYATVSYRLNRARSIMRAAA